MTTHSTPDFASYDVILVNTSAGKDSQAMLSHLVDLATTEDFGQATIIAVHCDLGRVEWQGTAELAQAQADAYGIRMEYVKREGTVRKDGVVLGDLLDQVVERHESNVAKGREIAPWPSSTTRWCTSDQKTSQVGKLITSLAAEFAHADGSPVRILNCLGIRAQESAARAKKEVFGTESSNSRRHVDRWLPIFDWTTEQVWATIKASGLPYHQAYDQGMERLSCCFCVLATKADLIIAAKANPALATEYAAVEAKVGWRFTDKLSMADIIEAAQAA